ncbi:MAG: hypothetical protein CSA18_04590 [Deltaproteobacteria bacterium]|nr:MAG: hypothetical protein CSA18_04590 [Deltaproteobacteria bacterium]
MDKLTENNFFDGSVKIFQNKNGYRFSIDSILLAHHVKNCSNSKILDIGTGSGIIPISIAYRNKNVLVHGVEIQESLYKIAKKNTAINQMENIINIIHKDILKLNAQDIKGHADIVVTNPPYRKTGTGKLNILSEKACARHELHLDIDSLLLKTKTLLKNKGRFYIIYPASRASELIYKMEKNKIPPKKIRLIHSFPDSDAVMIICEGILNGNSGVQFLPPLFIYKRNGEYSGETIKIIS